MKLKQLTQADLSKYLKDFCLLVGIDQVPTDDAVKFTAEILSTQFGHLTAENMMEAASLFAGGRINGFDHYQKFSPAFMGKLMTAMERIMKQDGRLQSIYDSQRQFTEGPKPTGTKCDWADYLNDLYKKFKKKELEPITLFIPLPCYQWCVDTGRLEPDSWQKYSTKASDTLAGQRKLKTPEFVGIGAGLVVSTNAQTEAKKMAVLDLLVKKLQHSPLIVNMSNQ
jgi:hypothetical protein